MFAKVSSLFFFAALSGKTPTTGVTGLVCLTFTAMDGADSRVVCGANVEGGAVTAATAAAAVDALPRCWCGGLEQSPGEG
jgi:hypothetical protein